MSTFNEKSFENAAQLEEGRSPTSPTFSEKTVSFNTNLTPTTPNRTHSSGLSSTLGKSAKSSLRKAATWGSDISKAVKPNFANKVETKSFSLEDFPIGYPRIAQLLASDDSFMFYRKFSYLHSRLLLHKQDQLRELEDDLRRRDDEDSKDPDRSIALKSREEADDLDRPEDEDLRSRQEILALAEQRLMEYGKILEQAHRFQAMERPTDRDHASVTNYCDAKAPFCTEDRAWLLNKEDLVTIRTRERSWLDSSIEGMLRFYPRPAKWLFSDEISRSKSSDADVHYFSRSRISWVVSMIILIMTLILLVVPIWVLFFLSTHNLSGAGDVLIIGILLISTLIFSCVLSFFTNAKRHELLGASAAYAAVLVVFVSNVSTTPVIGS